MKKTIGLFIILTLLLTAGSVSALPFTESYSAEKKGQKVKKGENYNFGFDMWFDNDVYGIGTDSNLKLTNDSNDAGAQEDYSSGTLTIEFYRKNKRKAKDIDITLSTFDGFGNATGSDLWTFNWNRSRRGGKIIQYTFDLTDDQLGLFDNTGVGNINIASNGNNRKNIFFIKHVDLIIDTVDSGPTPVTPVPEPATMLLLGTGLVGMVAIRRKRKKVG